MFRGDVFTGHGVVMFAIVVTFLTTKLCVITKSAILILSF